MESFKTVVDAIDKAVQRGVYTLVEAELIARSLRAVQTELQKAENIVSNVPNGASPAKPQPKAKKQ